MSSAEIQTYLLGADLAGFSITAADLMAAANGACEIPAGDNHRAARKRLGEAAWAYWITRGFYEGEGAIR